MSFAYDPLTAQRGAKALVRDHMKVRRGENVLITADFATDPDALRCVSAAVDEEQGRLVVLMIPILPLQGRLADPYLNEMIEGAATEADVWIDLAWPYLAGSGINDRVLHAGRNRYLLAGDLDAGGLGRVYGAIDLAGLTEIEQALREEIGRAIGKTGRVKSDNGTDFSFVLAQGSEQLRPREDGTGHNAPPGSVVMLPEPDSVSGTIVVDAMFHEYYSQLATPLQLHVKGDIKEVSGGGADRKVAERALARASGDDTYGKVIHLTYGFHPAARFPGASFIEGIRHEGNNAIGLGRPFWEPGGGENHPDAVLSNQSIWLDGQLLVQDGSIVHPSLAEASQRLRSGWPRPRPGRPNGRDQS